MRRFEDDDSGKVVLPPNLNAADVPALFWDEMPENAENHPDMLALQSIIEEYTPEERAANFKVSE